MYNKRILYSQEDGTVAIVVPAPGITATQLLASLPPNVEYEIVDVSDIPTDRTFRNAWEHDTSELPQKITHNMSKAIEIAHNKRREKRAADLAPHDEIIMKQIPGKDAAAAEAARQAIRDNDALLQIEIDNAQDADELKAIITREGM